MAGSLLSSSRISCSFGKAVAALSLVDDTQDSFAWRCTDSGQFSVASAYRVQFLGSTASPLLAPIWRAWAPAKHRLLAWLMVQNRVLTADRLMARRWPNCYFCQLCRRNLETAEHLLVECLWSCALWGLVAHRFRLASFDPGAWHSASSLTTWLLGLSSSPTSSAKVCKSMALMVIWAIWRERNTCVFREIDRPASAGLQDMVDERST